MVKVGEVEFLVKFDGINTEFKKVLSSALKEAGIGKGGDGRGGVPTGGLERKVDSINSYLAKVVTPTGKSDDFITFLEKFRVNYKEFFTSKTNLKKVASALSGNTAILEKLGISDVTKVSTEKLGEVVKKESKRLFSLIMEKMVIAAGSPEAHSKLKSQIGKAFANLIKLTESEDVANSYRAFLQATIDEAKHVTRPFYDILKSLGIQAAAKKSAGGAGEVSYRSVFGRGKEIEGKPGSFRPGAIGTFDVTKEIITSSEALQKFMIKTANEMGEAFTGDDIQSLFFENLLGPSGADAYKSILEDVLLERQIKFGTVLPPPLVEILEDIVGYKLQYSKASEFGAGGYEEFESIFPGERTSQTRLRRASDVLMVLTSDKVRDLIKKYEELTGGATSAQLEAIKQIFETTGIEKLVAGVEAKALEAKLNEPNPFKMRIGGMGGMLKDMTLRMLETGELAQLAEKFTPEELQQKIIDALKEEFKAQAQAIENMPKDTVEELKTELQALMSRLQNVFGE